MNQPRFLLPPSVQVELHFPVVFQMQVVRDGAVLFAIERQNPTSHDIRDMESECRRLGATNEDQLVVVSRDSRRYSFAHRRNVIADLI